MSEKPHRTEPFHMSQGAKQFIEAWMPLSRPILEPLAAMAYT